MQWEISRLLCAAHGNIFIVGDVGQAIYSFRGCSPEATVGQFGGAYPNGDHHPSARQLSLVGHHCARRQRTHRAKRH